MNNEEVIQRYKEQEEMMILLFAQWCVNYDLDPIKLYAEAYPDQSKNDKLVEVMEQTVSKEEGQDVTHDLLFTALETFGNTDLLFVVQSYIDKGLGVKR